MFLFGDKIFDLVNAVYIHRINNSWNFRKDNVFIFILKNSR